MPMADIPFPSQASSGNWSFEIIGLASATASITKKFIRYESPRFQVCGTINGRTVLVDCCVRIQIGVPPKRIELRASGQEACGKKNHRADQRSGCGLIFSRNQ